MSKPGSKRSPKFKITFKKTTKEVECNSGIMAKSMTEIKVNGDVVGHIYPPKYSTYATDKFHVIVLMRVIGIPSPKTLKPVFSTEDEARDYIKVELYAIHCQAPLYLENPPKQKHRKLTRFSEDWIKDYKEDDQ